MSMGSKATGAEFLVRKSDLAKTRQALPSYKDILIVDDENMDANRLVATMRTMFGYDLEVRRAKTLLSAVDMVLARTPDFILLDDRLKPTDTALDSIPMIRRANYHGPIVVISGDLTRDRCAMLMAHGATETIHKDELNSVAIAAVLTRLAQPSTQPATQAAAAEPAKSSSY